MKYEELTLEDLKRMQEVDVRTVNIEDLTDLRDIQIDTKLPVEEKLRLFAEQTNNLYIHRIGDYVVKGNSSAFNVIKLSFIFIWLDSKI